MERQLLTTLLSLDLRIGIISAIFHWPGTLRVSKDKLIIVLSGMDISDITTTLKLCINNRNKLTLSILILK